MIPDRIHQWEVDPPPFEEDFDPELDRYLPCLDCGARPCCCAQIEDYLEALCNDEEDP